VSQISAERLHYRFFLAQQTIHNDAGALFRRAQDHHGQVVARHFLSGQAEDLAEILQGNHAIAQPEHFRATQAMHLGARHAHDLLHRAQRQGVSFVAHFHQQHGQNRQRQRQF
jgi:hypothetical protein